MEKKEFELDYQNRKLKVEFSNLTEQANSSCLVSYGETVALVTLVTADEVKNTDFVPLTVDYEEKYYAVGKILGSRFLKRESRPSEKAILNSRLIDRAIRPLFPSSLKREVQIITTCVSWDKENDPSVLALLAASIALSISDIPWKGPLAPLRIGKRDGKFNIFSNPKEREENGFDLTISALKSESGKELLVNMIEAELKEASEEEIAKAIKETKETQEKLISFQKEIIKKIGKEKIKIEG